MPGSVLVLKDGLLAVGTIGFKGAPDKNKIVEIGYGINATHWGQRLAAEAVAALVAWAFESDYANHITAKTAVDNVASQRVLEKSGFTKTGAGEFDPDDCELILWKIDQ